MENNSEPTENGYYAIALDVLELLPLTRAWSDKRWTYGHAVLEGLEDGRLQQQQQQQQQQQRQQQKSEHHNTLSVLPTEIILKIKEHYLAAVNQDYLCGSWLAVGRTNMDRFHPNDCCAESGTKKMLEFEDLMSVASECPEQDGVYWVYHLFSKDRVQGFDARMFFAFLNAHKLELCYFPNPLPEYRDVAHRKEGKGNPLNFEGMNIYIGVAGQAQLWTKVPPSSQEKTTLIENDAGEAAKRRQFLKAFAKRYNLTLQPLPSTDGDKKGEREPGYAFRKRYPDEYDSYPGVN